MSVPTAGRWTPKGMTLFNIAKALINMGFMENQCNI